MSDATPLEGDDLRKFAEDEIARHTPANQPGNGYDRCAECHFTRHPCDVYDLAAAVIRLLDKLNRIEEAYIEAANPGIDMDEVRRTRPRFMLNTKTGEVTQLVDDGLGFPEMRHE